MLKLESINRSFSGTQVLHDVSFTAERGSLTGFVGGNGAGKTTAMRIILGVLKAHSGTVTLDGQSFDSGSQLRCGYMPEERGLYPKMKISEQVAYLARLHGFSRKAAATRARDLLENLGLGERLEDTLSSLSLGNQQRVQIAAALAHQPDVLILDEPFSGLDPLAVERILELLKQQAAQGAIVLFSSHQLDVVERLCDDLVIIDRGKVIASGQREKIQEQFGVRRYTLRAGGDLGWVRDRSDVEVVDFSAHQVAFTGSEDAAQQVLVEAMNSSAPVRSFTPKLPSLSTIFAEVTAPDREDSQDSGPNMLGSDQSDSNQQGANARRANQHMSQRKATS